MHFLASNNAIEYEALLHGLRNATALSIHQLKVLGDYARCQSSQQRVVMSGRQNVVVLPGALQIRK
jgi:ribonuclease HI